MANSKDCRYYKKGTICDKCNLVLIEQDFELEKRFKIIHNLEDAKTREDLKSNCAQIIDALLYLNWDSPDDAGPLFDKHRKLIGGQAVIAWVSKPGAKFEHGYKYNWLNNDRT
jgi:hypothetical protein